MSADDGGFKGDGELDNAGDYYTLGGSIIGGTRAFYYFTGYFITYFTGYFGGYLTSLTTEGTFYAGDEEAEPTVTLTASPMLIILT